MGVESRKAEKRKARREKKREQLEKSLFDEKVEFDVIGLLERENIDTKPNMAKFLKEYVQVVRAFVSNGKIQLWPSYRQDMVKVFVKFLDGHELIWNRASDGKFSPVYVMCEGLEEVKLRKQDTEAIAAFFERLVNFGFI